MNQNNGPNQNIGLEAQEANFHRGIDVVVNPPDNLQPCVNVGVRAGTLNVDGPANIVVGRMVQGNQRVEQVVQADVDDDDDVAVVPFNLEELERDDEE